jgi:hypothetical protein
MGKIKIAWKPFMPLWLWVSNLDSQCLSASTNKMWCFLERRGSYYGMKSMHCKKGRRNRRDSRWLIKYFKIGRHLMTECGINLYLYTSQYCIKQPAKNMETPGLANSPHLPGYWR